MIHDPDRRQRTNQLEAVNRLRREIARIMTTRGARRIRTSLIRRSFVVALLAAVAPLGAQTAGVDDPVPPLLHAASSAGSLDGLRWPRFPDYRRIIDSLYAPDGWQPIWTASGRPTREAREALDLLRSAERRALHPDDYDAALLERRLAELSAGAPAAAKDVAWFDMALSVGVLRHLSDVHVGRVNPRNISVGINVQPKKLDLARVVRDAIAGHRVASLVRDIEPRFAQYRSLLGAYARYRALADSQLPAVKPARTTKPGERLADVAALRQRLVAFGDLPEGDAAAVAQDSTYDRLTAAAVARFQARHGLAADSVLGPATVAAIGVAPAVRARQLELAIERIRWLPAFEDGPFIVVNVPSFELYAFDRVGGDGSPSLIMNVVVGKAGAGRSTPLFEDEMRYIIFRPYWVIPPGILRSETLPGVRRDRAYLARNDMELYRGDGDNGPAVAATAANLSRVASGTLGIRQRPGPRNSLGLAKFIFPNDHNVYLHGTPATELFSLSRRDFSHGCIRVQDPAGLAVWVLRDSTRWSRPQVEAAMDAGASRRVNLARPLPVTIYYTTAVVRPGNVVAFYGDVYGHDARLERALAKGYPYAP
jgi:murein L,D-transpeptidase YcbB/YkuD